MMFAQSRGSMNSKLEMRHTQRNNRNFLRAVTALRAGCVGILLVNLVLVRTAAGATEDKPAAQVDPANDKAQVRHGSLFVDPLGLALFGPRVGVEVGAEHVAAAVYGRWMNEGLLSHSIFLNSGDKFDFSYGVGVRGRYYLGEGLQAMHLGLALEYLRTSIETPSVLIVTKSAYFVPQLEVGYRIPIGGFYLDGSGMLGYAFKASGTVENQPGGSDAALYQASDESRVYGAASLELGVYF
jgi:hypothetical protein